MSVPGIVSEHVNDFRPFQCLRRPQDHPAGLFRPSEDLHAIGWPDFSVRSLADWSVSVSPPPIQPDDCCLILTFPRLAPDVEAAEGWEHILHETGGVWEETRRIVARKLEISQRGVDIIHAIGQTMAHSNRSAKFALFDQLLEYRTLLNGWGLDCNCHIQCLAEGFYPIDLTEEALRVLEVIAEPSFSFGHLNVELLCLAVLAPNCSEW